MSQKAWLEFGRRRRPSVRDEREEEDGRKRVGGGDGRTKLVEARGRSFEIQFSKCYAFPSEVYCHRGGPKEDLN
jgi:hypothetical protein